MVLMPTPYSILNDPDDGEDVFETIFPQWVDPNDHTLGERPFWEEKRKALWARFHDTGLGNPDKPYWERCMMGKALEIEDRYQVKFRVWSEYQTRLSNNTGDVDISDGEVESQSVNRNYDPPEVAVSGDTATNYLADQNTTDYRQVSHGGTEADSVRQYMDDVSNPFEDYAREFDRLFYWGL